MSLVATQARLHHRPHAARLGEAGRKPGFPAGGPARLPGSFRRLRGADRRGRRDAASMARRATLFEPGGRWNALIDAVSSYYNGAEYDRVSVLRLRGLSGHRGELAGRRRLRRGHRQPSRPLDGSRHGLRGPPHRPRRPGAAPRHDAGRGRRARRHGRRPDDLDRWRGACAFTPRLGLDEAAAAGLPLGLADKVFLRWTGREDLPVDGRRRLARRRRPARRGRARGPSAPGRTAMDSSSAPVSIRAGVEAAVEDARARPAPGTSRRSGRRGRCRSAGRLASASARVDGGLDLAELGRDPALERRRAPPRARCEIEPASKRNSAASSRRQRLLQPRDRAVEAVAVVLVQRLDQAARSSPARRPRAPGVRISRMSRLARIRASWSQRAKAA